MDQSHSLIIVAGATASGKSFYAESLAAQVDGELVNADAVQMYEPLAIGTAKPAWREASIPHHLFDICTEPVDYDVVLYRAAVEKVIRSCRERKKQPILVGGSLFYIKSLFYPPVGATVSSGRLSGVENLDDESLWQQLQLIDPVRASQIHFRDRYRVERALYLWKTTGLLPSALKPTFQPFSRARIIFIDMPTTVLYDRINQRTNMMMSHGWINEARQLIKNEKWRSFVATKNFIGYRELFSWIENGEQSKELPAVVAKIQQLTRNYAKRQQTFWRSFCAQIQQDSAGLCEIQHIQG